MKLYNDHRSSYEELLTYYPEFYREVYEMVEILKAQGKLVDNVQNGIEQVFSNQFIDSADEEVISLYEKISGIVPDRFKTIEERRKTVKSHLIGSGKISASVIADMIRIYTDSDTVCSLELFDKAGNQQLYINADIGNASSLDVSVIEDFLSLRLPAHLNHELSLCSDLSPEIDFDMEIYESKLPECGRFLCGQYPFGG